MGFDAGGENDLSCEKIARGSEDGMGPTLKREAGALTSGEVIALESPSKRQKLVSGDDAVETDAPTPAGVCISHGDAKELTPAEQKKALKEMARKAKEEEKDRKRKEKEEEKDRKRKEKEEEKDRKRKEKEEQKLKDFETKRPGMYVDVPSADTMDRMARAYSHRLFLIECTSATDRDGAPVKTFAVMGNTGNVYHVNIGRRPNCTCPDHIRKRKPCKHMIFVMLRVLKCSQQNPLVWQMGLTMVEVRGLHSKFDAAGAAAADVVANAAVVEAYRKGSDAPEGAATKSASVAQKEASGECPICFDELAGEAVVYCKASCGQNIHAECFKMWSNNKGANVTCVYCRAPWDTGAVSTTGAAAPRSPRVIPVTIPRVDNLTKKLRATHYENLAQLVPAATVGPVWQWKSSLSRQDGDPDAWCAYSSEDSKAIEAAYAAGATSVPIGSSEYVADLERMVQHRNGDPIRRRPIRRVSPPAART